MKKILIPTDFSDNGADAFSYTLNLIGETDAKLHVITVIEPMVNPSEIPGVAVNLNQEAVQNANESLKTLELFANNFFEKKGNVTLTTNAIIGQVSSAVKKEAETVGADLIVMGTMGEGHSNLEKIIGTVSSEVIKNAPCPVILVPRTFEFKAIERVVFSTGLDHSDPFELWRGIKLLHPHVPIVRCVHVVKDESGKNDPGVAEFAEYLHEHSPGLQTLFHTEVSDDVETTVNEYAEYFNSDLIVMHRSKKSFWERVFGISHTKLMAFQIKIPLMVLNT